jgi:glycosyltransferase involved in cell wall biosynthesis
MLPLLSIAIPAYNRCHYLAKSLELFRHQISGKYEKTIEIVVTDDCSTDSTKQMIQKLSIKMPYLKYVGNSSNIGLERNLIECTKNSNGKYVWIFGDDDCIVPGALDEIIPHISEDKYEFILLNRLRVNAGYTNIISANWMGIDPAVNIKYEGVRSICRQWGIISVIGFITANIFLRKKFLEEERPLYYGTMYPQLAMMIAAFHSSPSILLGRPLFIHRTLTQDEKKREHNKPLEKAFMTDEILRRDAKYFGFRFVNVLHDLAENKCIGYEDISDIKENTVINGYLIDFVINNLYNALNYKEYVDKEQIGITTKFFTKLKLSESQKNRLFSIGILKPLSISVITPSFNQAKFLHKCLDSVRSQTVQPLEQLVFDPGSTDGSLEIARSYEHATLVNEPDAGQSDAINKGFTCAKGDIIAWVNADDYYHSPEVFQKVIARFEEPDKPDIIYGNGIYLDGKGNFLRDAYINKNPETLCWRLHQECGIMQPAVFFRKSVVTKLGALSETLHFCMDYHYWIRCVKGGIKFTYMNETFASVHYHTDNKTYGKRSNSYREVCEMLLNEFGYVNHNWLKRYAEYNVEGFDGVLKTAANTTVNMKAALEQDYIRLLQCYNTSHDVWNHLEANFNKRGYGDTLKEMKRLGLNKATPCHIVPLDKTSEDGFTTYKVGPRRFAFDCDWKKSSIRKTHNMIDTLRTTRNGDVCVIVGNGPSLSKIDKKLLRGVDLIISNNVFLSEELTSIAKYYTVVNYLVAEQGYYHINSLQSHLIKIIPYWLSYCINPGQNTYFIDAVGFPKFSIDIKSNVSWRHTVSFYNMHIAYGLGYRKVILIGFDHSYKQAKNLKEGEIIQENTDDVNHFNPEYFRGKKWQAADVVNMEAMYILAKEAYENDGREIINCTVGGNLEIFLRRHLEEELGKNV